MPTKVYTNSQFGANGVDLSAYLQELVINYQAEMLDETAMGDLTRARIGGLKVWSFAAKLNEDFAAIGPAETIRGIVGCHTCVQWRPENAYSTERNPYFTGIAAVDGWVRGHTVTRGDYLSVGGDPHAHDRLLGRVTRKGPLC